MGILNIIKDEEHKKDILFFRRISTYAYNFFNIDSIKYYNFDDSFIEDIKNKQQSRFKE